MKKICILFLLTMTTICVLCACGKSGKTEQNATKPAVNDPAQLQQSPVTQEQTSSTQSVEETTEVMFGYRFTVPVKYGSESKASGALFDTDSWDLYIYGSNYLNYTSWSEVVDQCKDELFDTIFSAIRFRAKEQTATAEESLTNKQGVEMMRVTGELSGSDGSKPYIAYYYVTDENYTRFMIVLNYEKESDAAKVIDYVAERLEKA